MLIHENSFSQSEAGDSTKSLSEVIVKAFGQNSKLKQTAAAINFLGPATLERYNPVSVLQAFNATPGARMEERSPGSYRMNIRGSTLRSPFGVRNVKIYYDDLPLTDPGGSTYLNQLNYSNFYSVEIIKGPGGSLYGAGTGGVILIRSQPGVWRPGFTANLSAGSYGLVNTNISVRSGKDNFQNTVDISHQYAMGYRHHTSMRRDVANWQMKIRSGKKEEIRLSILYGDLYYQTPGALTLAEFKANPRASRPKAGAFPSADSVRAAIFQKTVIAGITNEYRFTDWFTNTTSFYGAYSEIKNPTFRNYEKRTEPHMGGRTVFNWHRRIMTSYLQFIAGAEAQKGFFNTSTYAIKNGRPKGLLTNDDIHPSLFSLFAQADLRTLFDLDITAGVSMNKALVIINRLSVANFTPVARRFNNELAPRIAVSKRIIQNTWLYGSISRGFSPPTAQEILPSTSVISTDLQAEHGVSYEVGLKNSFLHHRLYIEINAFDYRLKNAIVQRKDANNADYFANAGSTRQRGIESQANYHIIEHAAGFLSSADIFLQHTLNAFRYLEFKQSTTDFSGNHLPSVAPTTVSAGLDLVAQQKISLSLTYYYSDHIALNDANTEYAAPYHLFGGRVSYTTPIHHGSLRIFVGGDNLFNTNYSLGNDINATGGRYYNVAEGRNFYGGAAVNF